MVYCGYTLRGRAVPHSADAVREAKDLEHEISLVEQEVSVLKEPRTNSPDVVHIPTGPKGCKRVRFHSSRRVVSRQVPTKEVLEEELREEKWEESVALTTIFIAHFKGAAAPARVARRGH